MEWLTGKMTILKMVRDYERRQPPTDHRIWRQMLDVMGIDLTTSPEQLARIPRTGPLVIVANHPHGLVDGIVMAELIARVRTDYKVLTRSLLTSLDEVAGRYLISVPFPHDADAQAKGIQMRAEAMAELAAGGVVALFPSGVVATSRTAFGPVEEAEWNVFTAKMIHRSGAQVVPIYFPGTNTRWYHLANSLSATLRQGLLLHEVVAACQRPHGPVVGEPISAAEAAAWKARPREFMAWLRERTLALKP
jgi:putative hemolysin